MINMKTYGINTKIFCDFLLGGKPKGKIIEIIKPGDGRNINKGLVKVKLTETYGAYQKDEELVVNSYQAVPLAQELKLIKGQFTRRINTNYQYL